MTCTLIKFWDHAPSTVFIGTRINVGYAQGSNACSKLTDACSTSGDIAAYTHMCDVNATSDKLYIPTNMAKCTPRPGR